jgi:hypothetical protein
MPAACCKAGSPDPLLADRAEAGSPVPSKTETGEWAPKKAYERGWAPLVSLFQRTTLMVILSLHPSTHPVKRRSRIIDGTRFRPEGQNH